MHEMYRGRLIDLFSFQNCEPQNPDCIETGAQAPADPRKTLAVATRDVFRYNLVISAASVKSRASRILSTRLIPS
jgi:hypothetical protein